MFSRGHSCERKKEERQVFLLTQMSVNDHECYMNDINDNSCSFVDIRVREKVAIRKVIACLL